jgi:hypothetical protein
MQINLKIEIIKIFLFEFKWSSGKITDPDPIIVDPPKENFLITK